MKKVLNNKIEVEVNNNRILRLSQTEEDRIRNGIALESVNSDGTIDRRDLISEGDFVMLMNYYRNIKDYDIQDDFINPNGINNRERLSLNENEQDLY